MLPIEESVFISSNPIHVLAEDQLDQFVENVIDRTDVRLYSLDGNDIDNKGTMLSGLAEILRFPYYFGMNWDALVDCLRGMPWDKSKKYVIAFHHADRFFQSDLDSFRMLVDIMLSRSREWTEQEISFHLLFGFKDKPSSGDIGMSQSHICIH